ncbi:MAG TPA: VPLPA-CTERM sorting domain-containing protein [Methylophilus sp.]
MKKTLIALGFSMIAMSTQAATLSLSDVSPVVFSTVAHSPTGAHDVITGALGGVFGTLSVDEATIFRATFLGKEANDVNFYVANGSDVPGSGINVGGGSVTVGDSFEFAVSAGVINFGFRDATRGTSASNIGDSLNKIAYITTNSVYIDAATGNPYAFIIGFNDSGSSDRDYDDYVIGVSAVPVPAALPLMASALGMFGVARRRKVKQA